jgi:MFS family permease
MPTAQATTQAPPSRYRYYVTGVLTLAFTFNFIDRQIISILAEQIKAEFSLSDTQLGLLMGFAFALFYTFIGLGIARIADRTNRVNLISSIIVVWSVMTALCGMAANFVQLFGLRMMVGVGEAGLSPSSHSIISDYFDEKERVRPISIYSLGTTFGHIIALLLGGYIAHKYGWRMAFIVVGLPGVLVAVLVKLTVREPKRGAMDPKPISAPPQRPLLADIKSILAVPLYRYAAAGHVFTVMFGFTLAAWIAAHYMRSFGLGEHKAAPIVALILVVGGVPGMIFGGFAAARLAKHDMKWLTRLPALFALLAFPFYIYALLSHDLKLATAAFMAGTFALQASFAPPLAAIQHAVPASSRALAAALAFFFSNLIGLGMGPVIVGMVSDTNAFQIGPSNLSLGLLALTLALPLASLCLWKAQPYLQSPIGDNL